MKQIIRTGSHVISALRAGQPLVALETAVVTHGLPKPLNLEAALGMEKIVRENSAVPATIGVLRGEIVLGLTADELKALAAENDVLKYGKRELPLAAALGKSGGATVSAAAFLAHRYGIAVLATGGIGGVHRGGNQTLDISSDLTVLGGTPISVVSSGVKAILDIKLTLEYLETAGVTVVGYNADFFPAFYSRTSPYSLRYKAESAAEVAGMITARDDLGFDSAFLVCQPVPEHVQIPWEELVNLVEESANRAETEKTAGQDVTPRMLHALFELSGGRAVQANLALLYANARLGAEIANELKKIKAGS